MNFQLTELLALVAMLERLLKDDAGYAAVVSNCWIVDARVEVSEGEAALLRRLLHERDTARAALVSARIIHRRRSR